MANFLAPEAKRGLKPPTLTRTLTTINCFHDAAGFLRPRRTSRSTLVLKVLEGVRHSRKMLLKPEHATAADIMLIPTAPCSDHSYRYVASLAKLVKTVRADGRWYDCAVLHRPGRRPSGRPAQPPTAERRNGLGDPS